MFNIWRSKVGQEMIFCQIWLVHVTVITPSTIGRHKLLLTHCHSLLCTEASLRIINTVHDSQRRSHECCLKAVCWSAWACVLRASLSVSGGCLVTLSPRPRHLIHHPMPGDVRGDRWSLVCQGPPGPGLCWEIKLKCDTVKQFVWSWRHNNFTGPHTEQCGQWAIAVLNMVP